MFRTLVGSGDRIGLLAAPFIIAGLVLNAMFPTIFSVGGPPLWLKVTSILVLIFGMVIWAWSVFLIITRVPKKELITTGPYSLVKHPLYTCVALLVLPWLGFLLNSWLGLLLGVVIYFGSRMFSSAEERVLAKTFGAKWRAYCRNVKMPWL